jgi:hypothetical protein
VAGRHTLRRSGRPRSAIIGPIVVAAPGLLVLALVTAGLIRRKRKDRVWRSVAPHFAQLHERAWYCGRCGGAFFTRGTVPDHVLTETLIPIGGFRDTVWLLGHQQWERQSQKMT